MSTPSSINMMLMSLLICLFSVTWAKLVVHESRASSSHISKEWTKSTRVESNIMVLVRVSLKLRNLDAGHQHLMDISNPESNNYGKHWTSKEVNDLLAPAHESVKSVREWLSSSGISGSRHKISSGHIRFNATILELENLLSTQYHLFHRSSTNTTSISCEEYSVPDHILHHIDFISPGITSNLRLTTTVGEFSKPPAVPSLLRRMSSTSNSTVDCSQDVTPECWRALYDIPLPPKEPIYGNDIGVFQEGDVYAQQDLDIYFTKYAPQIPNGTHPDLVSIDGGQAPYNTSLGVESNLDFTTIYPLIYPQQIRLFQVLDPQHGKSSSGGFDLFLDAIDGSYCDFEGGDDPQYDSYNGTRDCGKFEPTNVIGISYAFDESEYPPKYEERQCSEFMRLGLQGVSVIVSSGDQGTNSKEGCPGIGDYTYRPLYLGTCPYVTAVGATQIGPGKATSDTEEAWIPRNTYTQHPLSSGGGFSNRFSRPSWQDDAVKSFLNGGILPSNSSLYNSSGRGYPDVSTNGFNSTTIYHGEPYPGGATSGSAQLFAAIINLINGERIAAGKSSVGYLNPTLYANPDAFNDVIEGFNVDCRGNLAFNATKGWDPVTGLGTPNYPRLRDIFMKLP